MERPVCPEVGPAAYIPAESGVTAERPKAGPAVTAGYIPEEDRLCPAVHPAEHTLEAGPARPAVHIPEPGRAVTAGHIPAGDQLRPADRIREAVHLCPVVPAVRPPVERPARFPAIRPAVRFRSRLSPAECPEQDRESRSRPQDSPARSKRREAKRRE